MLGEYAGARTHLEQGLAPTDPTAQRTQALRHGEAPEVRCLTFAAVTLWCLGYPAQAETLLRLLAEALTAFEANGRGDMLAEAYRLQGQFLLWRAAPDAAQAEACFQQALVIARLQQAKSWELRVAMSLARLWQQKGKLAEAHELLAEIYNWFTEGLDTADLQEPGRCWRRSRDSATAASMRKC
jgi:predicted ATPase